MSVVPVPDVTAKIEELVKYIQEDLEGSLNHSEEKLREIQRLLDQCTEVHTVDTLWVELVADACSETLSKFNFPVVNPVVPAPETTAPTSKKRQRGAVPLSEPSAKKRCVQVEGSDSPLKSTQGRPPYTITGPPLTKKEQVSNWMVEGGNMRYSMSKDSRMSVRDLWNEYQLGSVESVRPVKWLNWYFGTCWRAEETPRQYYHRRQVIYREVERMVQHRLEGQLTEGKILQQDLLEDSIVRKEAEARAVEWLDQWPRGPYTVHQMGQQIERARKVNPKGELPAFKVKKGWENHPPAPCPWYTEDAHSLVMKAKDSPALSQREIQPQSSPIEGPNRPATLAVSHSMTSSMQGMIYLSEACIPSGFPESNIRGSSTSQTNLGKGTKRPWEL